MQFLGLNLLLLSTDSFLSLLLGLRFSCLLFLSPNLFLPRFLRSLLLSRLVRFRLLFLMRLQRFPLFLSRLLPA